MQLLDENRRLSEQDSGPFLEVATLYDAGDGTFVLELEAGYSAPFDEVRYSLASRPARSLAEVFSFDAYIEPLDDQSKMLSKDLGVPVTWLENSDD